jgi:putative intracellular protease/amidase
LSSVIFPPAVSLRIGPAHRKALIDPVYVTTICLLPKAASSRTTSFPKRFATSQKGSKSFEIISPLADADMTGKAAQPGKPCVGGKPREKRKRNFQSTLHKTATTMNTKWTALTALLLLSQLTLCQEKKVLFVMSAARELPLKNGKSYPQTGVFLNEFFLAYKAIREAGYGVDFATPGAIVPGIDKESYSDKYWKGKADLKAEAARFVEEDQNFTHPLSLEAVTGQLGDYAGLVVPGGQGLMVDLIRHPTMPGVVKSFSSQGKAVGLICHAPALILSIPRQENPFIGYRVNAVTGFEEFYIEKFVMKGKPQNRKIGRQLKRLGLHYTKGGPGKNYAVRDRELITSQNPFSSEAFGKLYLEALAEYKAKGSLRAPIAGK